MSDKKLCPTCHSIVSPEVDRVWLGDPILTPESNPLNGSDYRGCQFITTMDIYELQQNRSSIESELAITPPTEFNWILLDSNLPIRDTHLIELRISTERILAAIGLTLGEYFSIDADGIVQPPGPSDTSKSEWTDVARGTAFNNNGLNQEILLNGGAQFYENDVTIKDTPSIPANTFIKGMHIEDLRRAGISASIRWEQSCWESWDLTGIIPSYPTPLTHDHSIKPLSLLKHRWALWQDYQEYEIDEGSERFKKIASGTAHSSGGTGSMETQISEQVSLISNPGVSETRFSSTANGETHFSKGTTGVSLFDMPKERKLLKAGAKARFIWSADYTTYEKDSLSGGLPGYLWYEDWEIWGAAMISFSFVHSYYGGHTITYGIGPSASEGSWIEAPINFWVTSGDIVRNIYDDYSFIWGAPPSGTYLSSSRIFNYAYVDVSMSKKNASPPPDLIKSAYSNSTVFSIIYAELGDVS